MKTPESLVTNEDCMEMMKRYPDKFFELAIVDPPYGLGDRLCNGGRLSQKGRISAAQYSGKVWDEVPTQEYFVELFRVSEKQIIWGGNYFTLPPTRGFVIWDKKQPLQTFSFGEFAWTSFDCPAKKIELMYTNFVEGNTSPAEKIHPTQKPVALYKWLLKNYAKEGDKILDTHLGSGSSRIAAYIMGFDFYGCEIDKDYFDAQEKRFKEQTAQGSLFEYHKAG